MKTYKIIIEHVSNSQQTSLFYRVSFIRKSFKNDVNICGVTPDLHHHGFREEDRRHEHPKNVEEERHDQENRDDLNTFASG